MLAVHLLSHHGLQSHMAKCTRYFILIRFHVVRGRWNSFHKTNRAEEQEVRS